MSRRPRQPILPGHGRLLARFFVAEVGLKQVRRGPQSDAEQRVRGSGMTNDSKRASDDKGYAPEDEAQREPSVDEPVLDERECRTRQAERFTDESDLDEVWVTASGRMREDEDEKRHEQRRTADTDRVDGGCSDEEGEQSHQYSSQ